MGEISPNAVYDRQQAAELLGIGDTKLREIVGNGAVRRLAYTSSWRFLGLELLRFARESCGMDGAR